MYSCTLDFGTAGRAFCAECLSACAQVIVCRAPPSDGTCIAVARTIARLLVNLLSGGPIDCEQSLARRVVQEPALSYGPALQMNAWCCPSDLLPGTAGATRETVMVTRLLLEAPSEQRVATAPVHCQLMTLLTLVANVLMMLMMQHASSELRLTACLTPSGVKKCRQPPVREHTSRAA